MHNEENHFMISHSDERNIAGVVHLAQWCVSAAEHHVGGALRIPREAQEMNCA